VLSDNPTRAVPALSDPSDAVAVAAALAAEFRAGAVARDAARTVPREQLERIGHSGLLGITVPAAYGGADVTRATVAEVFRLLATADPSIAQIPQAHFGLIETLKLHGSDVQKQRFFSAILNGERFANAISERGTAAVNVRMTRLERTASGGVLDGRKYYSTGALTADWIAVTAQDEDNAPVFVLVPAGAEGLTRIDDWTGFGQRTSTSGTPRRTPPRLRFSWHTPRSMSASPAAPSRMASRSCGSRHAPGSKPVSNVPPRSHT
jgi:alkylation response protein AidB-like acyl-CoA dehydrogenase